jgi:hypothetical protein
VVTGMPARGPSATSFHGCCRKAGQRRRLLSGDATVPRRRNSRSTWAQRTSGQLGIRAEGRQIEALRLELFQHLDVPLGSSSPRLSAIASAYARGSVSKSRSFRWTAMRWSPSVVTTHNDLRPCRCFEGFVSSDDASLAINRARDDQ